MALPMLVFSQTNAIQNFYSKYKDHEEITALSLSGSLIQFAASFADDEGSQKVMDKVTHLKLLVSDSNLVSKKDYLSFSKSLKKDAFEDLMQIKDQGSNIDIMIREQGDKITDVILLVEDHGDFVMISLEGDFKYSDLNDLDLKFEGSEHLKKLPEKRKDIPRA